MKDNVKKIGIYFAESKIYGFARKIYFILLLSFRETFFYKLFFKEPDEKAYEKSFINKFFGFIKNIIIKSGNLVNKILKRDENASHSAILSDIAETSFVLKLLKINEYKQSFAFLIFLSLLALAGILPTMVVIGLSLVSTAMIVFDTGFSKNIRDSKPIVTDMFIFLYLIALFYSRWISVDVQKNKIFLVYFVFVGLYFVVRFFISSEKRLYLALHAFSMSAVFVCLVGVFQLLTGSYKTSSWTDTRIFEDIQGRLVATFENPNVFGEYLLIAIPVIAAMMLISDTKLWKGLYAGLLVVSFVCMIMTYSRGCWLGLIFAAALFVLMIYPKIILPVCMVAPLGVFFIPQSIIERLTSIGNMQDGSTIFRVFLWRGTIDMLKDFWVCGIGLGTDCYEKIYTNYAYDALLAPHCHNTFLHIICESGIFGIIVFILLMFFMVRQLLLVYSKSENKKLKIISAALVCAFAGSFIQGMFDNTFYNYRLYMIFFATVAISCAIYALYLKEREKV